MKIDELYESAGQVGLAFFGGLVGALMRREASTWQTAMLGAVGAGFVGLLVAKLCHATGLSDDLTFVFVGVSGWLGASRTIDYLERLLESRLGLKLPHAGDKAASGDHEAATSQKEKSNETNSYTSESSPRDNAESITESK
jgi:hypothetical protein